MYKVPSKFRNTISKELKKFLPLVQGLQAKGRSSTEDDARILLNDILSDVLGYDKYNELKTEMRAKNSRYDYVVKLSEGPLSKKADRFDFVIEAKAASVDLNTSHVDQTLSYCLTSGMDYFILTNAVKWRLYKVKNFKKSPEAFMVHEVDFGSTNDSDSLVEAFYLFSKAAYLNGDWKEVTEQVGATSSSDICAAIMCDKVIRAIAKELSEESGIKIDRDKIKETIADQLIKRAGIQINMRLLKKFNEDDSSKKIKVIDQVSPVPESTLEINEQLPEDEKEDVA